MNPGSKQESPSIDSLPDDVQEHVAGILDDYLAQLEQGGSPNIDDLVKQHPDLAEPLRAFLMSIDFLHDAAAGIRSDKQEDPDIEFGSAKKLLGDYCLIREIGRGGMGVVYEAKQISLDRRVALKVLPFAAVLDQRQIARFKNEAQAAAHLQHASIVPVYSVGCDRGVHYYAMQYIEGQSLDGAIHQLRNQTASPHQQAATADSRAKVDGKADTHGFEADTWKSFSDKASLSGCNYYRTAARIGAEAAEALEYAHQCGVIHRDIKPSNLLLDNFGKVWITDFGLARFQTDSNLTVTGDVMGTLRYMSPEQATGKTALVDCRTDIYSLGITLYELCTLTSVFKETDRQSLLHQVSEQDPPAPRHVNPAVPIDLETILLKAIAKVPGDRYATAGELADDLKHYLEGKPIAARRASLTDHVGKWARRHKAIVAVTVALLGMIMVGSLVSTLLIAAEHAKTQLALVQAEENFQKAEENLRHSETLFRQLREVVDRFGTHHAERLKNLPGAEPLRHELLVDALAYYRGFIQHADNDPTLQDELAVTYSKAAAINEQVGDKQEALAGYRQAAKLFKNLADDNPNQPRYQADWALCQNNIGLLLSAMGKPTDAEKVYRRTIATQKQLTTDHPATARFQSDLANTYGNLGLLLTERKQLSESERIFLEAVIIQKQLVDEFPEQPDYLHGLAISHNNLSFLYVKSDPVKAQKASEQSLAIQQGLVKKHPTDLKYQSDLALNYNNLGALQSHNGRPKEAEASYRRAIALQEQLTRKSPFPARFRHDLAISHSNLGRVYSKLNQFEDAQNSFQDARTIMQNLADDYPEQLSYRSSLGGIFNNLGMLFEKLDHADDALKSYQKAIAQQQIASKKAPTVARFREFLSKHYSNYHRVLRADGRWKEDLKLVVSHSEDHHDDPEGLYRMAVELAMVAEIVGKDKTLPSSEATAVRQKYVKMAIDTITQAMDAGLGQLDRILQDPKLSTIRKDPGYDKLLQQQPLRGKET